MESEESNDEVNGEHEIIVSKKTLRKREIRAEKARKEGRIPGIVGRPERINSEVSKVITDMIIRDADEGIFHDISWLTGTVCTYFDSWDYLDIYGERGK
jgi:hypothetical protein